ncbi:MAG TPA: TerB family tellurite resistance protein [Bacteroidia bacterium]|nr:TerB family tellurite resistance protein [Bacteroidia bacterium]
MAKFGKWVVGGLGWAFGGPIGGLIGFALGSMIDEIGVAGIVQQPGAEPRMGYSAATAQNDFAVSLLVLTAAVMKGDGKVLKSELDYVKNFLVGNFGEANTQRLLPVLKELLTKEIPLRDVCLQVRQFMPEAQRIQLLQYLFGISAADGDVHPREIIIIQTISDYLGIDRADYESIKAMHYRDVDSDYKILEVDASASDEELKKAYRKMAVKFHPDKVADLGEDAQKAAKERFQKVQDAWENVKKQRGIV